GSTFRDESIRAPSTAVSDAYNHACNLPGDEPRKEPRDEARNQVRTRFVQSAADHDRKSSQFALGTSTELYDDYLPPPLAALHPTTPFAPPAACACACALTCIER